MFPSSEKNSISLPKQGRDYAFTVFLIACAATLWNCVLLYTPLCKGTYDGYIHMFFASHYLQNWFEPWDTRWYGGFDLTSYPPLVHQLMALLDRTTSTVGAYRFIQLSCFPMIVVGTFRFAKIWTTPAQAVHAAIAAVFVTSIAQSAYAWGQLPTLFATGFLLNGLASFHRWIMDKSLSHFYFSLVSLTITLTAHHFTTLFSLPLFIAALMANDVMTVFRTRGKTFPSSIGRSIWFLVCSVLVACIVFSPFLWYTQHQQVAQKVIRHGSRANFAKDFNALVLFFLIPWGALLFFIPAAVVDCFEHKPRRMLGILVSAFGLLGVAGTIPYVDKLLGPAFYILTLDRFTLWASVAILPFVGVTLALTTNRQSKVSLYAALVLLHVSFFWWLENYKFQPEPLKMVPIAEYLSQDNHKDYRYLTLGFGSQMAWLSTISKADSIDGLYHTVRPFPELRESGIEALDGAKYFNEEGMRVLTHFLANAAKYHLRYILNTDPFYDEVLSKNGWKFNGTNFEDRVKVWERSDVPPVTFAEKNQISALPIWAKYIRGSYPILVLLWVTLAIGMLIRALRNENMVVEIDENLMGLEDLDHDQSA